MGIDIYAAWERQNAAEKKSQYTGFDITAGKYGYLREAYHGEPYVTHYLVSEAFNAKYDDGARIPATTLRERLPIAVLLAMFRQARVYERGKKDPMIVGDIEDKDISEKLMGAVMASLNSLKEDTSDVMARQFDERSIAHAEEMIKGGILPDYAQSFVDFVVLCEEKEKETGAPCIIRASY